MANAEKLNKLVEVIEQAQERNEWDQDWYAAETECGTVYCAAGWQCVLEGKSLKFETSLHEDFSDSTGGAIVTSACYTTDGFEISEFARLSLDMTPNQAYELFLNTDTDLEEFKLTVKRIIADEIE